MKKILRQYKTLLISAGAVLLIGLPLILVLIIIHGQDTQRVQNAGLAYAKRDCLNRRIDEKVCNNLESYVTSPGDYGGDEWLINVNNADDYDKFNLSMQATVYIWGSIKISKFQPPVPK